MLGILQSEKNHQWSQHISQLVHAYNCTKNDATGYSPYFLMFGREARLPVDLCFNINFDGEHNSHHLQYVVKLRQDLRKPTSLQQKQLTKII